MGVVRGSTISSKPDWDACRSEPRNRTHTGAENHVRYGVVRNGRRPTRKETHIRLGQPYAVGVNGFQIQHPKVTSTPERVRAIGNS